MEGVEREKWIALILNCESSSLPRHSISIKLEELEQVLGFLPVSGLLLSRQCVIRHEQRMSTTT